MSDDRGQPDHTVPSKTDKKTRHSGLRGSLPGTPKCAPETEPEDTPPLIKTPDKTYQQLVRRIVIHELAVLAEARLSDDAFAFSVCSEAYLHFPLFIRRRFTQEQYLRFLRQNLPIILVLLRQVWDYPSPTSLPSQDNET
ncbi:hypothetical protein [Photorhabdus tasmaniensis]|uniref:hypothetical protein n=1 Tax=Photorhabdus tasmaniensis TaxID=1004159 RepID=UPI00140AE223|nr:hypothetical protein [Photorhabdus tasmaniensis]